VHNTAEIGLFKVLSETSSAANVRRIEAVTGRAGVTLLRGHDRALSEAAEELRVPPERVPTAVLELRSRARELERQVRTGAGGRSQIDIDQLITGAIELDGTRLVAATVPAEDGKALLEVADRLKNKLGDGIIVLGSAGENRVDLIVSVPPSLVQRGVRAGEIVKVAAAVVGGGGGGRDTLARAGGRDAEKLPQALDAARAAVETALASNR
jgi:alanyl-tRNA synthetase